MLVPRRHDSSEGYRYGFQGQEKDDEIKGDGNSINYTYRIHDPRVGRFFAVDPLTTKFPHYTPYSFSGNKVIHAIELEGLEEYVRIYQYENGHATLLKVIKNSEVRFTVQNLINKTEPLYPTVFAETIDLRTGQKMDPSEIGMEQYQYVNKDGERLNIRRNHNGALVKGENEIMPIYDANYFGSIYIGPNNPTSIIDNKEVPDYRREPQDEVDAAALQHDKDYDKVGAAGFRGALIDKKTLPADQTLITKAEAVKRKSNNNQPDAITGKPVTKSTQNRAKKVSAAFKLIFINKL